MSDPLSEWEIVSAVAQAAAKRITRKVIAHLQSMDETLSGDDSELKTPWDEICVQVQYEASFFWDAYDETVRGILRGYVAELPKHEREAIWLQTDTGWDWRFEEPEERDPRPVSDEEILDYLTQEYVYAEADRWSNFRIRAYLDRQGLSD